MEVNRNQISPNFGMALHIDKKAGKFIESLPAEERKYLQNLGRKIKGSRNDINILEDGRVTLTYRPKASEIRLVTDSNKDAIAAADKAFNKKLKQEITAGEKLDIALDAFKTLAQAAKIKMSVGKSKFMKNLQVKELFQKQSDKADALEEKLVARINQKDAVAKKETENLLSEFAAK